MFEKVSFSVSIGVVLLDGIRLYESWSEFPVCNHDRAITDYSLWR